MFKITITLRGAIALWAKSRGLQVTKKDCDDLAEAIERLLNGRI